MKIILKITWLLMDYIIARSGFFNFIVMAPFFHFFKGNCGVGLWFCANLDWLMSFYGVKFFNFIFLLLRWACKKVYAVFYGGNFSWYSHLFPSTLFFIGYTVHTFVSTVELYWVIKKSLVRRGQLICGLKIKSYSFDFYCMEYNF